MTGRAALPNWVAKRDGRLEPFEGDKLCRSLFAAAERLGRPDPFLARELADGVLHFLADDPAADPLPTAELAEVVVKIVRELGHPTLSQAFVQYRAAHARRIAGRNGDDRDGDDTLARLIAAHPAARDLTHSAAGAVLADFARRAVYPRELVAAEREGLLRLFDAATPLELAGAVLEPRPPAARPADPGWAEALDEARDAVGQFLALDGPEYLLTPLGSPSTTAAWVRELRIGLKCTGLRAVINLNCATPPAWAQTAAAGPLFAAAAADDPPRLADTCESLLDALLDGPPDGYRVDWHLGEHDFQPAGRNRLLRLARRVLDGAPLGFVPDRPRRPAALAEGLDRQHPAVLAVVGVSLPRLVEVIRSEAGAAVAPDVFLGKLGSLARLAISAGQVRRDYLRAQGRPALRRGFLLDRARLVVVPLGLVAAVRAVANEDLATGPGLAFGRQILQALNAALAADQQRLPAALDGLPPCRTTDAPSSDIHTSLPLRQQIRTAAALSLVVESGTVTVRLPSAAPATPEELAHLIWYAWQQPGVVRLQFAREFPPRQLSAGW